MPSLLGSCCNEPGGKSHGFGGTEKECGSIVVGERQLSLSRGTTEQHTPCTPPPCGDDCLHGLWFCISLDLAPGHHFGSRHKLSWSFCPRVWSLWALPGDSLLLESDHVFSHPPPSLQERSCLPFFAPVASSCICGKWEVCTYAEHIPTRMPSLLGSCCNEPGGKSHGFGGTEKECGSIVVPYPQKPTFELLLVYLIFVSGIEGMWLGRRITTLNLSAAKLSMATSCG